MAERTPRWHQYFRFRGVDPERELREEFRFHLETEVEELIEQGVPEREAWERAFARFGDLERTAEECRSVDERRLRRVRRVELLDAVRHDTWYVVRGLLARPALSATIVATLAIGVGANAAVFTVVDRVFLRPPAVVHEPDAVRRLYALDTRGNGSLDSDLSLPEIRDIERELGTAFPTAAYMSETNTPVAFAPGAQEVVGASWVTPEFLGVLGVRPIAGRDFVGDDMRVGAPVPPVIISWNLWRSRLGGERSALGRTIRVDGRPVTIVGIAPRDFRGIDLGATDVWLPLSDYRGYVNDPKWQNNRGWSVFQVIARVPAGASVQQLETRAEAALRRGALEERSARPGGEHFSDPDARVFTGSIIATRGPAALSHELSIAVVLAGLGLVVLVIAAANAGNLMLGRALQRRHETALRVALGIRPLRLTGQIVLEALVVAVMSGAAALLVASWVGGALRRLLFPEIRWAGEPLDLRIALFAAAIALVAAIASGFVGLRETLRADPGTVLKGSARDGGGRRSRMRAGLVAVQAMLSLLLLVGTGLFVRTLYNVRELEIGFEPQGLISVVANDSAQRARVGSVIELARARPGVTSLATASRGPFEAPWIDLYTSESGNDPLDRLGHHLIDPGYFATAGIRILAGRDLSSGDRRGAPPVVVVNEAAAQAFWPGRSPLGECVRYRSPTAPCYMIVGVTENSFKFQLIEKPFPLFYFAREQRPRGPAPPPAAMIARVTGDPGPVLERLRAEMGDSIPWIAERPVTLMSETLAPLYRPWEMGAKLFAAFAFLAILLAGLGVYSVLAYMVALRTRELGVRLALGAQRRDVVGLVVREGIRHVVVGAVAGVAILLVVAPRLTPLLYEVPPRDPVILIAGLGVLLLGAVLAALLPARRAASVDPMVALRSE